MVAALLDARANPDIKDADGMLPVHRAAFMGFDEIVRQLLRQNATSHDDYSEQTSLLHLAIRIKDECPDELLFKLLLDHKNVDVNARDASHFTVLHVAVSAGLYPITHALLARSDIDVNAVDEHNRTPLIHAIRHATDASVSQLLKDNRVKLNSTDITGRTALHYAIIKGRQLMSCRMVEAGIDTSIKDTYGKRALDYVTEAQRPILEVAIERRKYQTHTDAEVAQVEILSASPAAESFECKSVETKSPVTVVEEKKTANGQLRHDAVIKPPSTPQAAPFMRSLNHLSLPDPRSPASKSEEILLSIAATSANTIPGKPPSTPDAIHRTDKGFANINKRRSDDNPLTPTKSPPADIDSQRRTSRPRNLYKKWSNRAKNFTKYDTSQEECSPGPTSSKMYEQPAQEDIVATAKTVVDRFLKLSGSFYEKWQSRDTATGPTVNEIKEEEAGVAKGLGILIEEREVRPRRNSV